MVQLPDGATGLHAQVSGNDGLYLFDTGGGTTIVSPATARQSGCHPWGQVTGFRATGERVDTPRCDNLHLRLAGTTFFAPTASILDLETLVGPHFPALAGLIALDIFAGHAVTIRPLAHELIVETPSTLLQRVKGAIDVPIRIVRDAEGVALSVDAAVQTPSGRAWMELDIGNLGPLLIGRHVASLLGLNPTAKDAQQAKFALAGGIPVQGLAKVGPFILDGDIGEDTLRSWDITLDLADGRAWFRPAADSKT